MSEISGIVIYDSMYAQYNRLLNKGKIEEANAYIKAILDYGFLGIEPEVDSDIWLYGFDSVKCVIDSAKVRYNKSVENGKTGGRPKAELRKEEVLKKKEELGSWNAVAKYFGVTDRTIRNYRTEWEKAEETENSFPEKTEKTSGNFFRNSGNGKNLNININNNINKNNNISSGNCMQGLDPNIIFEDGK